MPMEKEFNILQENTANLFKTQEKKFLQRQRWNNKVLDK